MNIKQVIVVRKDLNMRKGKLAAQVAHASMKVILSMMSKKYMLHGRMEEWSLLMSTDQEIYKWLDGSFTKIVVGVNSEKELMNLYIETQLAGLPHALILDAGKTEFKEPTYTALAIGPAKSKEIDRITGNLELL